MQKKIIDRITKESQIPNLLEILSDKISLSDLQSLLLEVFRSKVKTIESKDLFKQYKENRFVKPSLINPQDILEFDQLAYSIFPDEYEKIELSPVCPIGINSVLAPVDQNNIVTTIRNTEVTADSTIVLSLECALRRKEIIKNKSEINQKVKLCASHRLLRAQPFDEPAAFPHFRIFSLCTAGRDEGSFKFEINSLSEHIDFYLTLIKKYEKSNRKIKDLRILIKASSQTSHSKMQSLDLEKFLKIYPDIKFNIEKSQDRIWNYYSNLRFQIYIKDNSGEEYLIVDGGDTNWTQQLLSNRKERLMTSGMGSERFLYCFK